MSTENASATYEPGSWTALVVPGMWLLGDFDETDTDLTAVWDEVDGGGGDNAVVSLVDRCAAGQYGRGFVALRVVGRGLVLTMGGEGSADVATSDRIERFDCPGSVASSEFRLASWAEAVRLVGIGGRGATSWPIGRGVVAADRLSIAWRTSPTTDDPATVDPIRTGLSPQEPSVSRDTIAVRDVGAAIHAPEDDRGATQEDDHPASPPTSAPVDPGEEADSAGSEGVVRPGGPDAADGPAPDGGGYDFLFGQTVHRSVEQAAVHPEEPQADHGDQADDGGSVQSESPERAEGGAELPMAGTEAVTPEPRVPLVRAETSGLIDSVPWAPQAQGGAAATPGVGPSARLDNDDDHDAASLTISRARQQEFRRTFEEPVVAAPQGPSVHAVHCQRGHPNPAHAGTCRVCGGPIGDQAPVTVPRPVLGVLRFSTGDVITLDRGVLIGRKPTSARPAGDDRPHLVRLPSPDQDLSRNHLEVKLDDWHVLVTDLDSTNGTVVTRPGREPERLRPNQATMIEPGTVVTLADVVTMQFEATE